MPYLGKSPSFGVRQRYQYTATASQTTFSGTDTANLTLNYTDNNFVDVFQNGVLLKGGATDYTATSGTSVVLGTGATADDVIEIIVYDAFSAGNFYNRTDSDSLYLNVAGDTMTGSLDLNGTELVLDVDGDTSITSDTDDQIDIKVAGADKLKIDGSSHLVTTTAGTSNLVLGVNAGNSIASGGNYNVALGDEAGTAITTGDENVCIGYQAGDAITTGTQNTAIGSNALSAEDAGNYNVAIGGNALSTDTKGNRTVAVGYGALNGQNQTSSTDTYNVAMGYTAGNAMSTGIYNTLIGGKAGDAIQDAQLAIVVGYNSDTNASGTGNQIVIGNNLTGAGANNVKFGTSGGTATLGLDGSDTSWAASSDLRLKTNVADCAVGLDFIKDLRPITFNWNKKDAIANTLAQYDADSSDPVYGSGKTQHGFIAQEVKTAINAHSGLKDGFTMWSEDPDGTQQVAPSALIPMLVKAVQELSAKNDALEARIKKLEDG